jgi:hypothetical protein
VLKEELIGDRNALFESAAIGEPFMEAAMASSAASTVPSRTALPAIL